jgi:hypothetical protein
MSDEVNAPEEKTFNEIIDKLGPRLKETGVINDIDHNKKPTLKTPRKFTLYGNISKNKIEKDKYVIGARSYGSEEYFIIARNSGKSLGKKEKYTEFNDLDTTLLYNNISNNICIGYISENKKEGGYLGNDKLLEKFGELKYGEHASVDKNYITFDNFLNELKQIPKPYKISIELIDSAENFVYIDDKIKNLEVNDRDAEIDKLIVGLNILLIKNITLEDKDILLNKEILRIKFSVGKLSDTDGKSYLKIIPQIIKRWTGGKFENFYKNIKGYTHIQLYVSKRDKIEYLLVKRKIIKNLLDDNAFIEEIKNIGIISVSEDSNWIKYSIDLDKIKETIKQNLPQGATLDNGKPLNLDTKSFLFYNKKEIKRNYINEGCIFKIKQDKGQPVNLLLLDKYEFKEFKDKLGDKIKELDQVDPDKLAIEARSSYLYPFIVVDLNGAHIKYRKIIKEVGEVPETPFLIPAPIFLSDTKNSLENTLTSYKIDTKRKSMVAKILYTIYEDYNKNPEIQKKVKRKGTYMEKILYAFINSVKGEAKRLGGPNQPDALLEDEDERSLYIFDTKNLKRTKLINNIKDRTKKYRYTFERYLDNMSTYNNGKDLKSYDKVHFIYVVDPLNENDKQQAEDIIRKTLSNKYKDKINKIEISVWSFSDVYKNFYP